ncbi:MAG: hypothetical protein R3C56_24695 [Pirellulaceae bacterium]
MRTIRPIHTRTLTAAMPLLLLVVGTFALAQNSQSSRRRPVRIEAPSFEPGQFEGIFFADPSAQLQGLRQRPAQFLPLNPPLVVLPRCLTVRTSARARRRIRTAGTIGSRPLRSKT